MQNDEIANLIGMESPLVKALMQEGDRIARQVGGAGKPYDTCFGFILSQHLNHLQTVSNPEGFKWIDKPVKVEGSDYKYYGQLLLSFPKNESGDAIRYIVRDSCGRLFIHNINQIPTLGR